MGYSIEIDEDTARLLEAEAARRNVEPQVLGREFVEERVRAISNAHLKVDRSQRVEELRQALRELEEISIRAGESAPEDANQAIARLHDDVRKFGLENAPFYPDEVMTREWIYQDHP